MALSLYNPEFNAFRNWTPPGAMSTTDMLLLNVIIELKIISNYQQLVSGGDEQTAVRNDIVSVT